MDKEKYEGEIRYIADTYGLVDQAWKLVEELSELLVAVMHDDRENIAEEMADVQIMIDQVAYLMDIRPVVERYTAAKIRRTIEGIEKAVCPVSSMSQVVAKWSQNGRKMVAR